MSPPPPATNPMSTWRTRIARAGARRHLERLANEIDALPPSAPEIEQAMSCLMLGAGAVELGETREQIANSSQLAIAGLHLTRRARVKLGIAPGPSVPRLTPGPKKTRHTPHYYPGRMSTGADRLGQTADSEWPIPAGWYSDPWWLDIMTTGNEAGGPGLGSMMLFDDDFPS